MNKIAKLNQNEINIISGGLGISSFAHAVGKFVAVVDCATHTDTCIVKPMKKKIDAFIDTAEKGIKKTLKIARVAAIAGVIVLSL